MSSNKTTIAWGTLDPFHEGGGIMGRTMANRSFLSALLKEDPFDEYHFFLRDKQHGQTLAGTLALQGFVSPKIRVFLRRELPRALVRNSYHCFHLSDCLNAPAQLARLRNLHSPALFPITSTTHSLSYHEYAAKLLLHLWKGTTKRDCIVATSSSGRRVVEELYGLIERNYNITTGCRPQIREIPLGVDTGEYTPPTFAERQQARAGYSIRPEETVLLVFGRISPHSKMDLLPLMRALQRVMRMGVEPAAFRLVVAGWAEESDDLPQTLTEVARSIGLPLSVTLRPDEQGKKELFRAADLFLSPVDNPQETFGLTLLEAAAFGLPVIASDYDGYRELVEDGRTGFLVSTIGPGDTELVDGLAPLSGDGHAHLLLGQRTAVCVPDLALRIHELIKDPARRQAMGQAARARVETFYAWEKVVDRYLRLWDGLWSAPVPDHPADHVHPLEIPYSRIFGHYPSAILDPADCLRWTLAGRSLYRGQEYPLLYSGMEEVIVPESLRVLLFLFRSPREVGAVFKHFKEEDPFRTEEEVLATILWALKHDLLETV
jgi:glycosyltransferase involved in cell wall biosynthesis